jgi:diguanylate cyclase (GGDEF)-like protein
MGIIRMKKYHVYRPSRILFLVLFVALLFFIFNGVFIYLIYHDTIVNTRITDLISRLRINIEKAGSMELRNNASDRVINQVDTLFQRIKPTLERISPLSQNEHLILQFNELHGLWRKFRTALLEYRASQTEAHYNHIESLSESCEILIDNLFSGTEGFMDKEERNLLKTMLIFIGINLLLIAVMALIVKRYIRGKLEHMATYDQLTVLFNRYAYGDILGKEIAQARRNTSGLCLILFDIDHFKHINDRHGHDTGDQVLKFVAQTVNTCIRKSDYLFRIGGEEFAIIAANTNASHAIMLAEKIRQTFTTKKYREDCSVTLSLGVAELQDNEGVDDIFRRADSALYKAKTSGRNRVQASG